jgi:hypothetical protein
MLILPNRAAPFFSSWDDGLSTLWISPAFYIPSNMAQNNLAQPVAALQILK